MTVAGLGGMGIRVPDSQPSKPKTTATAPAPRPISVSRTVSTRPSPTPSAPTRRAERDEEKEVLIDVTSELIEEPIADPVVKPIPESFKFVDIRKTEPTIFETEERAEAEAFQRELGMPSLADIEKVTEGLPTGATAVVGARALAPEHPMQKDIDAFQVKVDKFNSEVNEAQEKFKQGAINIDAYNDIIQRKREEAERLQRESAYWESLVKRELDKQRLPTVPPSQAPFAGQGFEFLGMRWFPPAETGLRAISRIEDIFGLKKGVETQRYEEYKKLEREGLRLEELEKELRDGGTPEQIEDYNQAYYRWVRGNQQLARSIVSRPTPEVPLGVEPARVGISALEWGTTGAVYGGILGAGAGGLGVAPGAGVGLAIGALGGTIYEVSKPVIYHGFEAEILGQKVDWKLPARVDLEWRGEKISISKGQLTEAGSLLLGVTGAVGASKLIIPKVLQWKGGKIGFKSRTVIEPGDAPKVTYLDDFAYPDKTKFFEARTRGEGAVKFFKDYPFEYTAKQKIAVSPYPSKAPFESISGKPYQFFQKTTGYTYPKSMEFLMEPFTTKTIGGKVVITGIKGKPFVQPYAGTATGAMYGAYPPHFDISKISGKQLMLGGGRGIMGTAISAPKPGVSMGAYEQQFFSMADPYGTVSYTITDIGAKAKIGKIPFDMFGKDVAIYKAGVYKPIAGKEFIQSAFGRGGGVSPFTLQKLVTRADIILPGGVAIQATKISEGIVLTHAKVLPGVFPAYAKYDLPEMKELQIPKTLVLPTTKISDATAVVTLPKSVVDTTTKSFIKGGTDTLEITEPTHPISEIILPITDPTKPPVAPPIPDMGGGGREKPPPPDPLPFKQIIIPFDFDIFEEKKRKKKLRFKPFKKMKGIKTRLKMKLQSDLLAKVMFGHTDLPYTSKSKSIFRKEIKERGVFAQVPTLEMLKPKGRKKK